ncbi:hypothetical protein L21SP2_2329 [Salinispira pacifica]|uniref:Methyl-accepting transducer domain-containing protein n=2 Tax=Salinispira pacifica TaxID=1307761 RepID=V5WJF4_9SPIO|nr:hypothetical protein L21SP2_2329 [Salinispira pacifica]
MKPLSQIYADADYEIKVKAPVTAVLQILMAVLFLAMSLVQLISGFPVQSLILFLLLIFVIITFILLLRGRYDLSTRLFCLSAALMVIANQLLQGYTNALTLAQYGLLHLAALVLTAFMIRKMKIFRLYLIFSFVTFWGYILYILISGRAAEVDFPFINQIDIAGFVYLIGVFTLYQLKHTFDLVTAEAKERIEESEKNRKNLNSIMQSVSSQLNDTLGLKEEAEGTEAASAKINRQVGEINGGIDDLNSAFANIIEALQKIDTSMSVLSERAQEQSSNVTESSAAIEQMVASISSVTSVIERRRERVNELIHTSERGAARIQKTEESFNKVVEHIDGIKEMTGLISGIASQTNLLAMNAAIEAAHAGDAGRGFAVVADEIRKLAENSSVNTKNISDTLKELISSIQETSTQVQETGATFSDIREEVGLVSTAMDEIYGSTQELNSGSTEILSATENLSGLTTNVLDGVTRVTQDNDIISENIDTGNRLAEDLKEDARMIKNQTGIIVESATRILAMANMLNSQSRTLNDQLEKEREIEKSE